MTLTANWADVTGTLTDRITVRTTYGPVTNEVTEDRGHVASFWSQLGRLLANDPEHVEREARGAYTRYSEHAGGVSKYSGGTLPAWEDVDEDVKEHWRHSVRGLCEGR